MGKLRKNVFYIMIPVALVLVLGSLIYYSGCGFSTVQVILCTLENTIMSFIARPTVNSFNAFRAINDSYSGFERLITNLYGFTIIIAPILTTTAVLAGFQTYVIDFFYSLKFSSRGKMYVIGDGRMAGKIAVKYADRYFVHYLMPSGTDNKARLPYMKKKVWAYAADYGSMAQILKEFRIEKAACVVLNYRDWFENMNGISQILERLMRYSPDEPTRLCIVDAPALYQDVFYSMYQGLCRKYSRPETVLAVSFVNTEEINAAKFFEHPELTEQPDGRHHVLLVGLGWYGSAFLTELGRYMAGNGLWGTVEIFDRDVEHTVNDLMYAPEILQEIERYQIMNPVRNAKLSRRLNTPEGGILTNYYQAVVGELNFTSYIEEIMKKEKFTEMFFCIDDISVNFECYRMIMALDPQERNIRMFFRIGQSGRSYSDAVELSMRNIRKLPDDLPDIELFG